MLLKSFFIRPLFIYYPQIDGGETVMLRVGESGGWIEVPVYGRLFTDTSKGLVFSLFKRAKVCKAMLHIGQRGGSSGFTSFQG